MPLPARKLDRIDAAALVGNPRATLDSWKKFEPVVLAAYAIHPRPYTFRPTNMSAASVASKLRDAIRGKIAFDYPSSISTLDLARWWSETIVKSDGESITLGPPANAKIPVNLLGTPVKASTDLVFDSLSFEEISAFALLISTNKIPGPVLVKHPPDTTLLPERPNVELMWREDGSLVIL